MAAGDLTSSASPCPAMLLVLTAREERSMVLRVSMSLREEFRPGVIGHRVWVRWFGRDCGHVLLQVAAMLIFGQAFIAPASRKYRSEP